MSAAEELDDLDDLEADFAPVDRGELALSMLVRGRSRRQIADELGVSLADVHRIVADGVRRRAGEAGTRREAVAVLHATLDDMQDRVYRALDAESGAYDVPALLQVSLGILRLRATLLAAERPAKRTEEDDGAAVARPPRVRQPKPPTTDRSTTP